MRWTIQRVATVNRGLIDRGPVFGRKQPTVRKALTVATRYRVVYTIDDAKLLVEVTRIRHRSEVYER